MSGCEGCGAIATVDAGRLVEIHAADCPVVAKVERGARTILRTDPEPTGDLKHERGTLRPDPNFPHRSINVIDAEGRWLLGTPFAVMDAEDLRAWAASFTEAAENLTRPSPGTPHCESEATGDLTRLDMHPDDLLGNENTRALCAHHLGQETPVTRPTLLKWRRERGFPEPLPCGRAGVELWDARQVRVWVQEHAANLPKHRPANLRNATGT